MEKGDVKIHLFKGTETCTDYAAQLDQKTLGFR